VTDGELRRESFQSELTSAVRGVRRRDIKAWLWVTGIPKCRGRQHQAPGTFAVVEPSAAPEPGREEFTFLRARRERPHDQGDSAQPDPVREPLVAGALHRRLTHVRRVHDRLVDVLRREVRELVRLAARTSSSTRRTTAAHHRLGPSTRIAAGRSSAGCPTASSWTTAVIERGAPPRSAPPLQGHQHSRWLVSGGYDVIAKPISPGSRPTASSSSTTTRGRARSTR